MKIRSATLADTKKIFLTHKASVEALCTGCYSVQDIAGWINILSPTIYESAIKEKIMIVAEKKDEMLGIGILDPDNKEIRAVYIHPKAKGTGIGKKILQELERRALENSADQLTLCSTVNALGFYRHHGYIEESKTFRDLPNGVRLECIRMHKLLIKK